MLKGRFFGTSVPQNDRKKNAQNDSALYGHVEELSDETSKRRFFAVAQNDRKKNVQNDV